MLSQTSSTPLTLLENQKYISLTTFRRTGAAVATPVWFVLLQDTLYLYTDATAASEWAQWCLSQFGDLVTVPRS